MKLDATDRKLLNAMQTGFPLVSRPFVAIGEELGLGEADVLERMASYREGGVLRQISAIFDTRRLGYQSILVAVRVDPARLDEVASVLNRHPGVSHNYGRTHGFNLWFTLAVHPDEDLKATVDELVERSGVDAVRLLPMERFFKIVVNFNLEDNTNASTATEGTARVEQSTVPIVLTALDIAVIRELQEDFPLIPEPYAPMAQRLGLAEDALFAAAADLKERGAMRRVGAVLHHRRAGITANAMLCWQVPPERAEEVGLTLANRPEVSHCYQRPTYPDWPYSHFSMVHARKRSECAEIARELSAQTGIDDYLILLSTREFKKTRVRYFVEDEWRQEYRQAMAAAGPVGH